MKTLTIKNNLHTNATLISNDFIDHYMVSANGEFVKIYLFLLRHLDDPCSSLSVSGIADFMNNTENDILRSLKYWESKGLLALDTDTEGAITGICIEKNPVLSNQETSSSKMLCQQPPESTSIVSKSSTENTATVKPPKAIPLNSFRAQKELKNLYFIAEQYLGKTLTALDIETITYFYNELGLSADVIEYLLGSCVENGHKSIHYIQKVALSWKKAGITTVEEARLFSANYNKNCYTVMNCFGIKGRAPAPAEITYIEKWSGEYGFSLDIIKEACDRTISVTHQPSFDYADKILKKWSENGVKHLQDIVSLDQAFQKNKQDKKSVKPTKPVSKNLNNFERRSYDMDSLEKKLLNTN